MRNIYIKKIILFITLILSYTNCSNFDDVNTNPEATTEASATLLCTNNVLSVSKFTGDSKAFISENAWSKYVGYANEGQMGAQYNVVGNGSFGGMTVLPNIEQMIEYAKGAQTEDSYRGVGKFLRAKLFYGLTMQMGDIPYSESNKGFEGNYTPKYDAQEDVLLGILDELKEASILLSSETKINGDPTPYAGDPNKWRRASNAFAIRILMSLSQKEGKTKIDIKKRIADIVAENQLMEASTGYWGLAFSTQNKYPLYSTSNAFTSRTILSSLLVDNLKLLSDRRLFYYAEPAKAKTDAYIYPAIDWYK